MGRSVQSKVKVTFGNSAQRFSCRRVARTALMRYQYRARQKMTCQSSRLVGPANRKLSRATSTYTVQLCPAVSSPPTPAATVHFLLRFRLGKIERKEKGVQGSGFWLFCSTQQLPRPAIGNLDSQIIFAAKCREWQQSDCRPGRLCGW